VTRWSTPPRCRRADDVGTAGVAVSGSGNGSTRDSAHGRVCPKRAWLQALRVAARCDGTVALRVEHRLDTRRVPSRNAHLVELSGSRCMSAVLATQRVAARPVLARDGQWPADALRQGQGGLSCPLHSEHRMIDS